MPPSTATLSARNFEVRSSSGISFWKSAAQAVAERAGQACRVLQVHHHGLILAGQVVVELLNELVGAGRCRGECRLCAAVDVVVFLRTHGHGCIPFFGEVRKAPHPSEARGERLQKQGRGIESLALIGETAVALRAFGKKGSGTVVRSALWAVPATVPDPFFPNALREPSPVPRRGLARAWA